MAIFLRMSLFPLLDARPQTPAHGRHSAPAAAAWAYTRRRRRRRRMILPAWRRRPEGSIAGGMGKGKVSYDEPRGRALRARLTLPLTPAKRSLLLVRRLTAMTEKQYKDAIPHLASDFVAEVSIARGIPGANQGRKRQENLCAKMLRTLDEAKLQQVEVGPLFVSEYMLHVCALARNAWPIPPYVPCNSCSACSVVAIHVLTPMSLRMECSCHPCAHLHELTFGM